MRLRHILPFALLFAWQVAPQRPDTTPPRTRVPLSVGYGLASLEEYVPAVFGCDGSESPEHWDRGDAQTKGARLDIVRGASRTTVFGGATTSGRPSLGTGFGGVQFAREGDLLGLGSGLTWASNDAKTELNLYLRIGSAHRPHLRADIFPPSETYLVQTDWRVGAECGGTGLGGTTLFAGVGRTRSRTLAGTLDLAAPVTGGLDLLVRAMGGPGHAHTLWGLALGARFTFPK